MHGLKSVVRNMPSLNYFTILRPALSHSIFGIASAEYESASTTIDWTGSNDRTKNSKKGPIPLNKIRRIPYLLSFFRFSLGDNLTSKARPKIKGGYSLPQVPQQPLELLRLSKETAGYIT